MYGHLFGMLPNKKMALVENVKNCILAAHFVFLHEFFGI